MEKQIIIPYSEYLELTKERPVEKNDSINAEEVLFDLMNTCQMYGNESLYYALKNSREFVFFNNGTDKIAIKRK